MPLSVPAKAGETSTDLRSLRFRLVVFLVRMWLCIAWLRITLPVPVTLKRFAAPLCVFCFGTGVSLCSRRALPASRSQTNYTLLQELLRQEWSPESEPRFELPP